MSQTKYAVIGGIALIVIFGFIFFSTSDGNITSATVIEGIPNGPIHWHPILKIIIDGKSIEIPDGVGGHQPIHTHDNTGTLHMESNRPTATTVVLGYFFKVWDKKFSKDCIFDYCTDKGTLKMTVNGKENTDFENYFMREGDNIVIEYKSLS